MTSFSLNKICLTLSAPVCELGHLPQRGRQGCHKKQKEERLHTFPPLAALLALFNSDDCPALVLTASLAGAMGHAESTAVGALDDIGSGELPNGRTPLVTSLSRYFSFWDCHVDTSC